MTRPKMRIINFQITEPKPHENWGGDKVIYRKGIFISFKTIFILVLICTMIYFYRSNLLPTFPNGNRYLIGIIVIVTLSIVLGLGMIMYKFFLKKIEKKHAIHLNSCEITRDSLKIDDYLILIQKEANKKTSRNLLFNSSNSSVNPRICFLGDNEYNLFFNQKEFYIKYNSILLLEVQKIIKSKTQDDDDSYEYYLNEYKLDERVFYFLERQLTLRINRLKQIQHQE